jgi:hypothetical protein
LPMRIFDLKRKSCVVRERKKESGIGCLYSVR